MASWTDQVFKWLGYGRYRTSPTPVGDGQVTELLTDALGRLQVVSGAPAVGREERHAPLAGGE